MNKISLSAAALLSCAVAARAQTDITRWNFTAQGAVAAPYNNPTPTTGTGFATQLGMTNNYTYTQKAPNVGAVASCDVTATPSTATPPVNADQFAWRVRGANPGNGWNLAAPQFTQGAEFDSSTVGFSNVSFTYDWFSTNQGVRDLQEQYNLNAGNAGGWTNIGGLQIAVPNDYHSTISIDLSGVAGAANDPTLGIRLVSAYDPTLGTYASATLTTAGAPQVYNNNSGNWRFDQVAFRGTSTSSVPEPSALMVSLFGIPGAFLFLRRRK